MEFRNFCRCRIRLERDWGHARKRDRERENESSPSLRNRTTCSCPSGSVSSSFLSPPLSSSLSSLHSHRKRLVHFSSLSVSSLVLHTSRLDCLFLSISICVSVLLVFFSSPHLRSHRAVLSHLFLSLSIWTLSTPQVYIAEFGSSAVVFVDLRPSVCLSASLCRIEHCPLNFNPAGIEQPADEPQLTNRTIDFTEEFQINFPVPPPPLLTPLISFAPLRHLHLGLSHPDASVR